MYNIIVEFVLASPSIDTYICSNSVAKPEHIEHSTFQTEGRSISTSSEIYSSDTTFHWQTHSIMVGNMFSTLYTTPARVV